MHLHIISRCVYLTPLSLPCSFFLFLVWLVSNFTVAARNILIDDERKRAVIADFGLSKIINYNKDEYNNNNSNINDINHNIKLNSAQLENKNANENAME